MQAVKVSMYGTMGLQLIKSFLQVFTQVLSFQNETCVFKGLLTVNL